MVEKGKGCYVCGRTLYDEYHCIFHSKKSDKDLQLFFEMFYKIFEDKSLKIYDFSQFIIPKMVLFPKRINKDTIFKLATFQGDVQFLSTTFQNKTDFERAIFKDVACFAAATFIDKINFETASFENGADFRYATFQNDASFGGSIFKGNSDFSGSTFQGKVKFKDATFEDNLILNETWHEKVLSNQEVDFRYVKFFKPEKITFLKVDLSKFRFLGTDLRKVEFVDVDWYKEKGRGRNKVYDEVSPDPETKKFSYPLIAQVYKRLRANYEENLNYAEAGDFHIGEMEMRRKGEKNFFNKCIIWAYKLISNYGESYWRPLCWIAILLLVFPRLYMLVGIVLPTQINGSQSLEKLKDYWSSFTYSLSVFSLVRERPYHTINNLGHILTILESIFSPVMIAFFLLALRRRFKR